MSKYYLLKFNDDYADEHDVPALECMTENEYKEWLNFIFGEVNKNYDEEKRLDDEYKEKYQNYIELLKKKDLYTKSPKDYTSEEKKFVNQNKVDYKYSRNGVTKLKNSFLYASLGNNGEYFSERYLNYVTGQDFINNKLVKVEEVDENFYNIFKKTKLNNLSLCNIFNIKEMRENYIYEYE